MHRDRSFHTFMFTFGAQEEPKDAPREPKDPKRSPKASPEASAKHAKVAFRPEAVTETRTCVQGVPPRTKKVAFLMDFGSFVKVFYYERTKKKRTSHRMF